MKYKYVDYKPYYNPKDVKDYELFIGPEGGFTKEEETECKYCEYADSCKYKGGDK